MQNCNYKQLVDKSLLIKMYWGPVDPRQCLFKNNLEQKSDISKK